MKEGKLKSYDGKELYYYLVEGISPKCVVQIAHGMQETSKTYFEFAEFLAKNGCVVFMFDERCHGLTEGNINNLGKPKTDMFDETVKDHLFVSVYLKQKYNLPLVFFGHSYGSFIGQAYLQKQTVASKVILSGSCYMKSAEVVAGKVIAKIQKVFVGGQKDAKLIESISLKKYPKYFHDDACWITSDPEKTKEFYADPYNGTVFSINFYYYMFLHQLKLYNKKSLDAVSKDVPVLIVSGRDDPVGKFGKGVTKLFKVYKKRGINAEFLLYDDMRHGVVQEKNRKKVFDDILNFIKK